MPKERVDYRSRSRPGPGARCGDTDPDELCFVPDVGKCCFGCARGPAEVTADQSDKI